MPWSVLDIGLFRPRGLVLGIKKGVGRSQHKIFDKARLCRYFVASETVVFIVFVFIRNLVFFDIVFGLDIKTGQPKARVIGQTLGDPQFIVVRFFRL